MLWAHFVSPTQKCNTVIHRKIRQDAQFVKQALAKIDIDKNAKRRKE